MAIPNNKKNSQRGHKPKNLGQGLTFDDVLFVPNYSEVLPKNVIIKTRLTKNISLNIPFISAAMDTVTEGEMAIAMAQQGGLGIIHKNLSITDQAKEVERVKRFESGRITNPITLSIDATVGDAFAIQKKYNFGGFPVLNKKGLLVGIVTNRDLRFQKDESISIENIMTTDLITGNPNTSIEEANELFNKYGIEKLPLVDKDKKLVGLITYRDMAKSKEYPLATKDKMGRLCVGAAVGTGADALNHVDALVKAGVDIICVDTAHGHSKGVLDAVKKIRKAYPKLEGLFDGIAMRVPVVCGSLVDITFIAKRNTTAEEINDILSKAAKEDRWKGIFTASNEELVSSDIVGNTVASIADLKLTRVVGGNLVKVLAWYDNEMGYTYTLVDHVVKLGQYI